MNQITEAGREVRQYVRQKSICYSYHLTEKMMQDLRLSIARKIKSLACDACMRQTLLNTNANFYHRIQSTSLLSII